MEQKDNYAEVPAEYLIEGMYSQSAIYILMEGKPVLLCKHTVITSDIIRKLENFKNFSGMLYVEERQQKKLLDQYTYLAKMREALGKKYENSRQDTKRVLDQVADTGIIPMEDASNVIEETYQMAKDIDLTLVMQCTMYMRQQSDYLYTHSLNVAMVNGLIGKWLELPDASMKRLISVGFLHDVGKVDIPPAILDKPGKLTEEEFHIIQMHPVYSYDILRKSGIDDAELLLAVRGHHEKINGSGYPDGLKNDEISFFARITAISDIYDAMVARRVYKDPISPFEVLDNFWHDKFSYLDMELVELFVKKMADELVGKKVTLSDGSIAAVRFVDMQNISFPLVEQDGKVFSTDKDLRCIAVCEL